MSFEALAGTAQEDTVQLPLLKHRLYGQTLLLLNIGFEDWWLASAEAGRSWSSSLWYPSSGQIRVRVQVQIQVQIQVQVQVQVQVLQLRVHIQM